MKLSTSILSSEDRIKSVLELNHTKTSYIHIDVMDGKFVSNVQFDTFEKVHSVSLVTQKPLDIHLMVDNPIEYIIQYKDMNIEFISFHIEIKKNIKDVIDKIHEFGYKACIAIKPDTDIMKLEKYLDDFDMILVMSVEPGRGGQKFISSTVDKIKDVKKLIGDRDILVEVDGGINDETIGLVQDVDIVVSGSYIINSDNYYVKVDNLLKNKKSYSNDRIVKEGNQLFRIVFWMFIFYLIGAFIFGIYAYFNGIESCHFLSCYYYQGWDALFEVVLNALVFDLLFLFLFFPFNIVALIVVMFFASVCKKMSDFSYKRIFISRFLICGFLIDSLLFLVFYIIKQLI